MYLKFATYHCLERKYLMSDSLRFGLRAVGQFSLSANIVLLACGAMRLYDSLCLGNSEKK